MCHTSWKKVNMLIVEQILGAWNGFLEKKNLVVTD